jgi:hypothetical protein
MASVSETKQEKAAPPVDAEAAIARIRERREHIAERECEQALGALRAQGEVS